MTLSGLPLSFRSMAFAFERLRMITLDGQSSAAATPAAADRRGSDIPGASARRRRCPAIPKDWHAADVPRFRRWWRRGCQGVPPWRFDDLLALALRAGRHATLPSAKAGRHCSDDPALTDADMTATSLAQCVCWRRREFAEEMTAASMSPSVSACSAGAGVSELSWIYISRTVGVR